MATRATSKKRAGRQAAAAAKKSAAPKAANGTKAKSGAPKAAAAAGGKRARAGVVNGERPDIAATTRTVTKNTIEEHARLWWAKKRELDEHNKEGATIKSELSELKKKGKKAGVPMDAVVEAYAICQKPSHEVREHHANVKLVLSVVRPETAKQLDLFVDTTIVDVEDPEAAGYRAYGNEEPRSNNPHRAGTEQSQKWDTGWDNAMNANILTMKKDPVPAGDGAPADATIQ